MLTDWLIGPIPPRAVTTSRCPECGTQFDPDDPATFETVASAWRLNTRLAAVSICLGATLVFAIALARGLGPVRILTAILISIQLAWAISRLAGLRQVHRMTRD